MHFVYFYWRCIGSKAVSVCSLLFRCTFLYKETANFLDYVWTIVKVYIHLNQTLTFTTLYEGCSLRQVVSENCLHRVESSIFRKGVLRKRVWVEKGSRKTYWRRLLDALFLTDRNFATFRYCHELSNGRCPWVWLCRNRWRLVPIRMSSPFGSVIFIFGVGSSVVCSAVSGNAKASISGTDNRRFHAFLCPYHIRLLSVVSKSYK